MSLKEKDQQIIDDFSKLEDWELRYKRIIDIGKSNAGLQDDEKNEDLKVKGCQSQVWILTEFKEGKIFFRTDSDAMIVKGLVTLLAELYSGETPQDISVHQPQFIAEIGLSHHLSPSRNNGLMNMLKQIKFYAIAYQASAKLE